MTKADLFSIDKDGKVVDAWIFDEILSPELPDAYALDLDDEVTVLGGPGSGRYPKGSGQNPQAANPLAGERHGMHTPEGMQKLISYLEETTGLKFKPHGSVAKGDTSTNDFDIVMQPSTMTKAERDALEIEQYEAEGAIWDQVKAGALTQDEAMQQIYGDVDAPDPVDKALKAIGFVYESSVEFDGTPTGTLGDPEVAVGRYRNPATGHSIEMWASLIDPLEDEYVEDDQ